MTDKILKILKDACPKFDFTDKSLNFKDVGYLNSPIISTIVDEIEKTFEVKINDTLIEPKSFQSVYSIIEAIEYSKK
jgi:acyl carrier protein